MRVILSYARYKVSAIGPEEEVYKGITNRRNNRKRSIHWYFTSDEKSVWQPQFLVLSILTDSSSSVVFEGEIKMTDHSKENI